MQHNARKCSLLFCLMKQSRKKIIIDAFSDSNAGFKIADGFGRTQISIVYPQPHDCPIESATGTQKFVPVNIPQMGAEASPPELAKSPAIAQFTVHNETDDFWSAVDSDHNVMQAI